MNTSKKNPQALLGDKVMLAAIVLSAVAAVILGASFIESGLAWTVSAILLAIAGLVFMTQRGTLTSRLVLTFIQASFVALHILSRQPMRHSLLQRDSRPPPTKAPAAAVDGQWKIF